MKRAVALTLLFAAGTLSVVLRAGQAPPGGQADQPKVVEVEKIKDNLYMLKGGGGNTAVYVADTGVVVVDTKPGRASKRRLPTSSHRHSLPATRCSPTD